MNNRKRVRMIMVLLLTIAFTVVASGLFAQVNPPGRINYQGVVRDASGIPVNGLIDMVFRFYDAASSGTLLWEETHNHAYPPRVTVSNGLFSVALGDATHRTAGSESLFPNVFALHATVYLAVTVGADAEMTPRIQVVSSPFAENADSLDGKQASDFANITHDHATDDITSGLLAVVRGGTGMSVPGNSGNILTSDGTKWRSLAPAAPAAHVHAANDINSGTMVVARGGTGLSSSGDNGNILTSNGAFWTSTAPDFANTTHVHGAADITSGTIVVARGGTGLSTPGSSGNILTSNGSSWTSIAPPTAGATGGVVDAYNTTLTRWGSGTGGDPYKLSLNLGSTNTWTGAQTFNGNTYFPGSGFWDNTGKVSIGTETSNLLPALEVHSSNIAIEGVGGSLGGKFYSSESGYAYVGQINTGIDAAGDAMGAHFADTDSSGWAQVGYNTNKIYGTGTVSFVQNHPTEKDRVIVYACPEGDEVATYTRGTAKLVNGEARIKLGETFKWVTNPDIGLTANLTPKGDCNGLYVESISTTEISVKELNGGRSDTAFDYVVFGLRIGFEESSIVQEKQKESYIPSFNEHRERYATYPELRAFNSLERFMAMESSVRGVPESSLDVSRAEALKNAIHEYDPTTDPPVTELFGHELDQNPPKAAEVPQTPADSGSRFAARPGLEPRAPSKANTTGAADIVELTTSLPCFPSVQTVEAGEVVVMDLSRKGYVRPCTVSADPLVVGIAAGSTADCKTGRIGEESSVQLQVPVATSGILSCKVDASYGSIQEGDLLVPSPTPGHAMWADNPDQGTVVGKALEPMSSGTGLIKVLVMLR